MANPLVTLDPRPGAVIVNVGAEALVLDVDDAIALVDDFDIAISEAKRLRDMRKAAS